MTDEPPKDPPAQADPPAPRDDAAVDAPAASVETAPTSGARDADVPSVEVAPHAYEAQPPTGSDHAASVDYVPSPIPFEAPAPPTGPAPAASSGDDAILPTALDDNALRDAIGAPPLRSKRRRRDATSGGDDDGLSRSGRRRVLVVVVACAIVVGLGITVLAFLGRANAQRYLIACTTDQVSAEQGRTFPPWGSRPLTGPAWKPITLPPSAECRARETDDRAELEGWFLELLVERASTALTANNLLDSIEPGKTNPLDVISAQLDQALLLSRAPERRDQRKEVERLFGDVQYWRASLRLREAAAALADASRQFDAAAAKRPRHVTDSAAWAAFLRALLDQMHAGPNARAPGAVPAAPPVVGEPAGEVPTAPLGEALPVEPEDTDAEPAPAPDAGLPTGGVLL